MALYGTNYDICAAPGLEIGYCPGMWSRNTTILTIDFGDAGLALYAERGSFAVGLRWIPWNTWPALGRSLGLSQAPDKEVFWGLVGSKVTKLLEAIQTPVSQGDWVKVLLTGDALSEEETVMALRSAVETALSGGAELWLSQTEPVFAASLGAAKLARQDRIDQYRPTDCQFEEQIRLEL